MTRRTITSPRRGHNSRLWRAGALAGIALLTVEGCGGDDGDASSAPTPSAATPATTSAQAGPRAPDATSPRQTGAISDETPETTSPATDPTTAAAPPTTGDITQTVAVAVQETLPPVPLDQSVEMTGTAEVELEGVERVEAEARLPGEVAGPAVAIRVRITNAGTAPIDLGTVTVNVHDADGQVSAPLTAEPAAPLEGELQPGDDAEGVYLFEFGAARPEPITIEVTPTVGAPIAVFAGQLS